MKKSSRKWITLIEEIKQAREKFDGLEWQWCAIETHTKKIEHIKWGFNIHPKLLHYLEINLDLNDLESMCILSLKIMIVLWD